MWLALRGRLYLSGIVSKFERNLTHWFISTQVPTAKTIIWRPPPQYSVDTSAWVPKYSPLPSRCPDDAPRRLGSSPLARMFGMFWGLCVINQ